MAASATPTPKTPVKSKGTFAPNPDAIALSSTPARTHRTDARALDAEPKDQGQRQTDSYQKQPIDRKYAGANLHGALQRVRHRHILDVTAPDRAHEIEEDEGETERHQDLIEMPAPVQWPQKQYFHGHAQCRRRDRRQHEGKPEIVGDLINRQTEVGAKHEKRAVRQAHDVHEPENQREAGRHQEQQHPVDEAVQQLDEKQIHNPPRSASSNRDMI
jgi:hypothetical protein